MKVKPVKITDTTLRDAHQSLWATRMRTEDMVPILEKMDEVGFFSMEMWGGATFDAPLRFLDENPWDRIRVVKKHLRHTKCQMLLRGQNLVGYRHYPDDIVKRFVKHAAECGIDVFRIFDALNDVRNLEVAIKAVKEAGKHAQGAVVYTISPVHTLEHYVETAQKLVKMGVDSICIKDMAGLLTPYRTFRLVEKLKAEIDIPIHLHCHYIGGMAPMNYLKGIEAGADIIDTASFPLAFGNSQPATEMIVAALKDTPYDTGFELELLYEIAEYWEKIREKRGFQRGVTSLVHMKIFSHQVPGGMISNLFSQLEYQKAIDRLPEVLEEIPRVRAEVGYPPLVTPLSQIVGTQAVLNVLSGKRWSVIPKEMKDYLKGLYGQPPGPIDPDIQKKVLAGEEPVTCRPADLLTETFEDYYNEIKDLVRNEEDVLSYALFPKSAREYLERHKDDLEKTVFMVAGEVSAVREGDDLMDVGEIKELIKSLEESEVDEVVIEKDGMKVIVRKKAGQVPELEREKREPEELEVKREKEEKKEVKVGEHPDNWKEIRSPMLGTFYRAPSPDSPPYVEEGDIVEPGQTLCLLEAMKLFNEVTAEEKGVIRKICVENAQPVEYGQVLFLYEPLNSEAGED